MLVAGTPAQPFLEGGNERMFGSIRSVTGASLTALDYLATQTGPPIAVRDWVRQGRGVLFLPYQANEIAALRSIISAWLRLAIFQAMSGGEGDQRLWFIVDELDALGPIDGLKDALARLRKFGGRCVLGFQSIAQVSSTYGHGEAQTIVENCSNTLILQMLSQRERRHRQIRQQTDRRTRSDPPDDLPLPPQRHLRRAAAQRQPRRTARHRGGGTTCRGRTAARPRRLPEIREPPRVAASAPAAAAICASSRHGSGLCICADPLWGWSQRPHCLNEIACPTCSACAALGVGPCSLSLTGPEKQTYCGKSSAAYIAPFRTLTGVGSTCKKLPQ